jgi:hypothetical protein
MLAEGARDQFQRWRSSRRRLSVCSVLRCPDLYLECSVSFGHGLKKTHHTRIMSFLNRARNSLCTVITDLDTSERSTQKPFSCCDAILELVPRPRSKHEKRTAGSVCETWTVPAADRTILSCVSCIILSMKKTFLFIRLPSQGIM